MESSASTPMWCRTPSAVIKFAARWTAAGVCAARAHGMSTALRPSCGRTALAPEEERDGKLTRPTVENHGRARRISELGLRLAPFELWLVLGPLFRRVALRLDARLAARRRRRSGRGLDPRRRGGRRAVRPGLRRAPRLGPRALGSHHRRGFGPRTVRPLGTRAALGRARPVRLPRTSTPARLVRVVRVVRVVRMVGVLRVLWMVWPAAPAGVVVAARRVPGERALSRAFGHRHVSAGDGTRPGLNARRWNRAAAQVPPAHAHVPPPVVVHRALWHARDEQ